MAKIPFRYYCEYWGVKGASLLVRCLPRPWALSLGRRLGRIAPRFLGDRYNLTCDNLRQAMPDLGAAQIEQLARANFEHVGMCGVEMLRFEKMTDQEVLEQIDELSGREHLDEALALGRGVLVLTGHLGFWELGFRVMPQLGYPCDAVAKPMKNPMVDDFFTRIRTGSGARLINSKKGARPILKALQQDRCVVVLLDQHISPPGAVETNFFGRNAWTTTAITNLAMKYQVPVVPIFCLRQKDSRYHYWADPMILLDGDGSEAVEANTQLLTGIIESAVRKDVTQWFWMHKRWRIKRAGKRRRKNRDKG